MDIIMGFEYCFTVSFNPVPVILLRTKWTLFDTSSVTLFALHFRGSVITAKLNEMVQYCWCSNAF